MVRLTFIHYADACSNLYALVQFASFQSGGFITVIVVNPPESKMAKRTAVQLRKERTESMI